MSLGEIFLGSILPRGQISILSYHMYSPSILILFFFQGKLVSSFEKSHVISYEFIYLEDMFGKIRLLTFIIFHFGIRLLEIISLSL